MPGLWVFRTTTNPKSDAEAAGGPGQGGWGGLPAASPPSTPRSPFSGEGPLQLVSSCLGVFTRPRIMATFVPNGSAVRASEARGQAGASRRDMGGGRSK